MLGHKKRAEIAPRPNPTKKSDNPKIRLFAVPAPNAGTAVGKTIRSKRHQALIDLLIEKREAAGLTQAELATRLGEYQSFVARLESGQTLPSTKTLLRYAEATGSKFHVRLSAA